MQETLMELCKNMQHAHHAVCRVIVLVAELNDFHAATILPARMCASTAIESEARHVAAAYECVLCLEAATRPAAQ